MKKIYAFLLLATTVLFAQAQTSTKAPVKNDAAAKKILDAVSAKFRTYKTPMAAFTYQIENAQGKALSTKKVPW